MSPSLPPPSMCQPCTARVSGSCPKSPCDRFSVSVREQSVDSDTLLHTGVIDAFLDGRLEGYAAVANAD